MSGDANKETSIVWYAVFSGVVWFLLLIFSIIIFFTKEGKIEHFSGIGSFFNIGTSLFTAVTIYLVVKSIQVQRKELKETNFNLRKQINFQKSAEKINRTIKLYEEYISIVEEIDSNIFINETRKKIGHDLDIYSGGKTNIDDVLEETFNIEKDLKKYNSHKDLLFFTNRIITMKNTSFNEYIDFNILEETLKSGKILFYLRNEEKRLYGRNKYLQDFLVNIKNLDHIDDEKLNFCMENKNKLSKKLQTIKRILNDFETEFPDKEKTNGCSEIPENIKKNL